MGLGVAEANGAAPLASAGVATVIRAEGIQLQAYRAGNRAARPRKSEAGFADIYPPSPADFSFRS